MVWTKNEHGQPYCWVDPSHKINPRDPEVGKDARFHLAMNILEWFHSCIDYLDPNNWTFKVDSDGKYLPGETKIERPDGFAHQVGAWSLKLHVPRDAPRMEWEAQQAIKAMHAGVTGILMHLVGPTKANKLLADIRQRYDLPKLRKVDLLGKQGLLF